MGFVRNPLRVNCHCGCLGVREFHDAGARVRRYMLVDRIAERVEPVLPGKLTDRPGFGVSRNKKQRKEELVEVQA